MNKFDILSLTLVAAGAALVVDFRLLALGLLLAALFYSIYLKWVVLRTLDILTRPEEETPHADPVEAFRQGMAFAEKGMVFQIPPQEDPEHPTVLYVGTYSERAFGEGQIFLPQVRVTEAGCEEMEYLGK